MTQTLLQWWESIEDDPEIDWVCRCYDPTPPNERNEEGHLLHAACGNVPASKIFICAGCDEYATLRDLAYSEPTISYYCSPCKIIYKDIL